MDPVHTRTTARPPTTGLTCPKCDVLNARWADVCARCGAALRAPVEKPAWLEKEIRLAAPPKIEVMSPWVVLGIGAALAPVFGLAPLLRYMGWFLASLVHEMGHCVAGWLFGMPAYPAIRLDGHAAAIHSRQILILVLAIMAGLAALTYLVRNRPRLRIVCGAFLVLYPVLAFTDAKDVIHLLAGHVGELAFAGVFFYRALSGGFTESTAERVAYATTACYLVGRNVVLTIGLMSDAGARAAYGRCGSFGLTNDYIRVSRHLGWSLEGVAALMLLIAVCVLPLALWAWRRLDYGATPDTVLR